MNLKKLRGLVRRNEISMKQLVNALSNSRLVLQGYVQGRDRFLKDLEKSCRKDFYNNKNVDAIAKHYVREILKRKKRVKKYVFLLSIPTLFTDPKSVDNWNEESVVSIIAKKTYFSFLVKLIDDYFDEELYLQDAKIGIKEDESLYTQVKTELWKNTAPQDFNILIWLPMIGSLIDQTIRDVPPANKEIIKEYWVQQLYTGLVTASRMAQKRNGKKLKSKEEENIQQAIKILRHKSLSTFGVPLSKNPSTTITNEEIYAFLSKSTFDSTMIYDYTEISPRDYTSSILIGAYLFPFFYLKENDKEKELGITFSDKEVENLLKVVQTLLHEIYPTDEEKKTFRNMPHHLQIDFVTEEGLKGLKKSHQKIYKKYLPFREILD